MDVKLSSSCLFRSSHRVATNLLRQAVRIIYSATITSTINYINTLWFGIVFRQGHIKRVSETSVRQWVSYWKGHEMQWWDSGSMQIPQFSQVHSMHALVLARLPFQKALSALQQFNLKQNTMHRSLARPRISPVRGGEQNFFSLQQSLCPWPGVAGCEQHEYVDCIKPSHHALPAIKHKNRKISRWEANYLQVKNGLSKYFEGELQALLKRSVTRERSHTWYQCTAAMFPIFWYRTLSHA